MTLGSRFRRQSGTQVSRLSIVVALLVCSFFVSGLRANVLAQDATPAAVACVAPDVPPGTPEPMEEMDMTASPEASPSEEEASPVAEEAAPTPPVGTPVEDQAVIDEATAVVENVYACLGEGNYLGALAFTTDNFRMNLVGTSNLYTAAEIVAQYFQGYSENITEVIAVYDNGDGSLSIDYQTSSGNQIFHYLDVLVNEDGVWKFDTTYDLVPETSLDSQTIGVKFGTADNEFVFEIAPTEFVAEPATIFQATNVGTIDHQFVLVSVPEGFDPTTLTNPVGPSDLPEGVRFVGEIYLEPGQTGDLLLEGLQPGSYVAYCLILLEDGTTHAEHGMFAQITVTEPVDLGIPDVVGTPAG